jgi:hypothetical protein
MAPIMVRVKSDERSTEMSLEWIDARIDADEGGAGREGQKQDSGQATGRTLTGFLTFYFRGPMLRDMYVGSVTVRVLIVRRGTVG